MPTSSISSAKKSSVISGRPQNLFKVKIDFRPGLPLQEENMKCYAEASNRKIDREDILVRL